MPRGISPPRPTRSTSPIRWLFPRGAGAGSGPYGGYGVPTVSVPPVTGLYTSQLLPAKRYYGSPYAFSFTDGGSPPTTATATIATGPLGGGSVASAYVKLTNIALSEPLPPSQYAYEQIDLVTDFGVAGPLTGGIGGAPFVLRYRDHDRRRFVRPIRRRGHLPVDAFEHGVLGKLDRRVDQSRHRRLQLVYDGPGHIHRHGGARRRSQCYSVGPGRFGAVGRLLPSRAIRPTSTWKRRPSRPWLFSSSLWRWVAAWRGYGDAGAIVASISHNASPDTEAASAPELKTSRP